ncbi:MAG: cobalt ECF transporter T component CbiQ [Methanobrevibacter sp.]|jgi:cobalt/nickel transport system permease protein|nr:cobalt ECF transporter T component CbiQ [Candidatus Methanoflexus mossambicus]
MNFEIDTIAHNNNLNDINHNYKIVIAIALLISALIFNSPIVSIFITLLIGFTLIFIAKIPFKFYLKFMSIPLVFLLITSIFMLFFFGTGNIIYSTSISWLVIREDAINLTITTFFRVIASFSALGFLAMTTPLNVVFNRLAAIKVPKIFIEIANLMYTTVFIFFNQIEIMRIAQKSRLGYNGIKNSYRSLGLLITNLFFKSLDRGEKLQTTLDSRCFSGDFPVYNNK